MLTSTSVGSTTAYADAVPAERCHDPQTKTFNTLGNNTEITVTVCIKVNSNYEAVAKTTISWHYGEEGYYDDKFDYLRIITRLESFDNMVQYDDCNLNDNVDASWSGVTTCTTPASDVTATNSWSADATVYYDINEDGEGKYTWNLTGSPLWHSAG